MKGTLLKNTVVFSSFVKGLFYHIMFYNCLIFHTPNLLCPIPLLLHSKKHFKTQLKRNNKSYIVQVFAVIWEHIQLVFIVISLKFVYSELTEIFYRAIVSQSALHLFSLSFRTCYQKHLGCIQLRNFIDFLLFVSYTRLCESPEARIFS